MVKKNGLTSDDLRAVETQTWLLVGDNDFIPVSHAVEATELLPYAPAVLT
jgi:hypothetical protein